MRTKFVIFILTSVSLVFLLFVFSLYKDIKINKLFNYLASPQRIDLYQIKPSIKDGRAEVAFDFVATDDYLGALRLKVNKLNNHTGKVFFRIKEMGNATWIVQTDYDYSYFKDFGPFVFGFPVVKDSNNKKYIVNLEFVNSTGEYNDLLVDLENNPILLAKYVFPQNEILRNPLKLVKVIKERSFAIFTEANYFDLATLSIIVSLLVISFILNFNRKRKQYQTFSFKDTINYISTFNLFIIPFLITLAIIITLLLGRNIVAQRQASYFWSTLAISLLWYVFWNFNARYLSKIVPFLSKLLNLLILTVESSPFRKLSPYFVILTILAFGLQKTYFLGGDDTRIFYIYPKEFLKNFSFQIVTNVSISSVDAILPPSVLLPFTLVLTLLKGFLRYLNLQSILYSANMIGGLYFFYKFISYLHPARSRYIFWIYLISSCTYVFSIFNFYVLFNSKLISIFLLSIFPLALYLIVKYLREGRYYYLVIVSLAISLFGLLTVALPWFLAAFICVIPILFFYGKNLILRGIKGILFTALLLFLLNFHWIVFLPFSTSIATPSLSSASIVSKEFRKENESGIKIVSEKNSIFFPLFNSYHKTIQEDFNWPYLPIYQSWYLRFLPLNWFSIALILIAGYFIKRRDNLGNMYLILGISFLVTLYFFTVNVTEWGISFFTYLNNIIPGFVLLRNMYDKFAFPLSFIYAVISGISLVILIENISQAKIRKYILVFYTILVIIGAKPFLFAEFDKLPIWTTTHSFWDTKELNTDYLSLIQFVRIQKDDGSKYLSLPLAQGNAVVIQDQNEENHFYNGVSPLLPLTGRNDFSGILSFGSIQEDVKMYLRNKEYDKLGALLSQLNIKYVIVNHSVPSDLAHSFVYADGIYLLQTEDFYNTLLGKKISDFGKRYSLYEISPRFNSQKIYLTEDVQRVPTDFSEVSYTKLSNHEYNITIYSGGKNKSLVFLEPFLNGWKLFNAKGSEVKKITNHLPFGYANAWEISSSGLPQTFKLYYKPYDLFMPVLLISGVTYIFLILYILKVVFKKT